MHGRQQLAGACVVPSVAGEPRGSRRRTVTLLAPFARAVVPAVAGSITGEFMRTFLQPLRRHRLDDRGMATAEYAVGTCAAAGLGGLLFKLLTGDGVLDLLTGLVGRAFSMLL